MRNELGGHLHGVHDQAGLKEPIKYSGHHMAPVELEDMLLGHPAVADVVMVASRDERILRRVLVARRDRALIAGVR